jgi:hypothetical protein
VSKLVIGNDYNVGVWVAGKIPHLESVGSLGEFVAISVVDNKDIPMAGIVYNNFRMTNIELQFASVNPMWATKKNIGLLLCYPFIQLGLPRITAIVQRGNKRIRKFLEGIGFKNEGTLRNCLTAHKGRFENAIIYGMIRKEAEKWLSGVNYGKEFT